MAQISITADEFPDIVACYLLECLQERKELPFINPLFDDLLQKMWNAGLRANLLHMFLAMNGTERIKYRLIRKALFNEGTSSSIIRVESEEAVEDEI